MNFPLPEFGPRATVTKLRYRHFPLLLLETEQGGRSGERGEEREDRHMEQQNTGFRFCVQILADQQVSRVVKEHVPHD